MNDFKLKLVLSILGGMVFSLIFILLAFSLPLQKQEVIILPQTVLEKVSHAARR